MPLGGPSNSIDRTTTLCLTCSSSLPPLKSSSSTSDSFSAKGSDKNLLHITKCCQRVICPICIASNPRLARYDPCLACLGGVSAVSPRTSQRPENPHSPKPGLADRNYNLDGAVRDEDTFILGGDSDDDEQEKSIREHTLDVDNSIDTNPPPPYQPTPEAGSMPPSNWAPNSVSSGPSGEVVENNSGSVPVAEDLLATSSGVISPNPSPEEHEGQNIPYKYYINRSDTLLGICLRFGVDSREVCGLNNLSPSAMRTTPHLLHTRSFILLPAVTKVSNHSSLQSGKAGDAAEIQKREERLVRERAEKRLQTLTKEVDWRVAKAYVALADGAEERDAHILKQKEMRSTSVSHSWSAADGASNTSRELEMMAVERYLDDDEWEAQERRAGRSPRAQPLPFDGNTSHRDGPSGFDKRNRWWPKSG